jgi:hypothetical protein
VVLHQPLRCNFAREGGFALIADRKRLLVFELAKLAAAR